MDNLSIILFLLLRDFLLTNFCNSFCLFELTRRQIFTNFINKFPGPTSPIQWCTIFGTDA